MNLINLIKQSIFVCFLSLLLFLSSYTKLSAAEVNWIQVAEINNKIEFIDTNSIKYDNKGLLSVLIKTSEINENDKNIIDTNSYLMAVDCENRVFGKLPINGQPKQLKKWQKPDNDKLIKQTIISSCSY